jgi:hypothetical protein
MKKMNAANGVNNKTSHQGKKHAKGDGVECKLNH